MPSCGTSSIERCDLNENIDPDTKLFFGSLPACLTEIYRTAKFQTGQFHPPSAPVPGYINNPVIVIRLPDPTFLLHRVEAFSLVKVNKLRFAVIKLPAENL